MKHRVGGVGIFLVSICLMGMPLGYAGELDDGISDYKDEPIEADDAALETDTNLSFTIVDSISSAKSGKGTSNFNDGKGDNNQNSIVVGPGTETGDIINVIIDR